MTYQQCRMKQNDFYIDAWIESRGATIGKFITLKDETGLWEVVRAGQYKISEEQMHDQERFFKSHRKGSDI